MREGVGRAAVVLCCCLPLFVNLGREDFQNDEAIYSFAIDRMVAGGDWLVPRALSPDDLPFLEKPPLKFWIVALPIRAGLLPPTELGHRFWDAAFGAAAFLYVFQIGVRLLNPLCGLAAVLLLFAHAPLVFGHGLRSNNMESALVLAYCGGVFHYLKWAAATHDAPIRRTAHLFAVAAWFVLAFMTKFVAALFLPLILGLAAVAVPAGRRRLRDDWWRVGLAAAAAAAAIAPWFVLMTARFGSRFWREIFGVHVYQRLTATLDPGHLQPWYYYPGQMAAFWETGALLLVAAGLAALVWAARRLDPAAVAVVLWFVVPAVAISAATSKLYHYIYPFLPAAALAGGYAAALALALGRAPLHRWLDRLEARRSDPAASAARLFSRPAARIFLAAGLVISIALAAGSLAFGRVRLTIGSTELASAGVLRPGLAAFLFAALAGVPGRARPYLLALLVVSFLPLQGYRDSLRLLAATPHPRRAASQCIREIQAGHADLPRGLRVELPDAAIGPSLFYYFEPIHPWRREPAGGPVPLLTTEPPPSSALRLGDGVSVVLPPPYDRCLGVETGT